MSNRRCSTGLQSRFRFSRTKRKVSEAIYMGRGTGRERCLIIEQGCRDDRGQGGGGKGDKFFFFPRGLLPRP